MLQDQNLATNTQLIQIQTPALSPTLFVLPVLGDSGSEILAETLGFESYSCGSLTYT